MEKCSLRCKDGKLFMEATHELVDCPECASRRAKELLELGLAELKRVQLMKTIPVIFHESQIQDITELFQHPKLIGEFKSDDIKYMRTMLENVIMDIADKKLPQSSLFIDAPQFLEMERVAYVLQKKALDSGYSISPYITLNQLSCLSQHCCGDTNIEGSKIQERYKVTYDDFIQADVCILSCSTNTCESGYGVLNEILTDRSRLSKATIVIGWGIGKEEAVISDLLQGFHNKNRYKSLELVSIGRKDINKVQVPSQDSTIGRAYKNILI